MFWPHRVRANVWSDLGNQPDEFSNPIITYTIVRLSLIAPPARLLWDVPCFLSTRNSPVAVAHLNHVTCTKYLFITEGVGTIVNNALKQGGLQDTAILHIQA